MDASNIIQTILIYALPVLFAITVHEAAHGYVAKYFGDNTALMMGRITLNPLKHIDPIGTILVPLLLLFATSGAMAFGYAKPVPVNFSNLRNPKRDMIWVALAGPASNFIMAILWAVMFYVLEGFGLREPFFLKMAMGGIMVNLVMFALNLFPVPPLDGGRIMVGLLPMKQAIQYSKLEPFGFYIVLALLFFKILDTIWLSPLMEAGLVAVRHITWPARMILSVF